jgi:hypothetical protein
MRFCCQGRPKKRHVITAAGSLDLILESSIPASAPAAAVSGKADEARLLGKDNAAS